MVIDYEGSSPQTASGMNSYINYTRSYSYAAVKCLTDPLGPMNEGALRPITVTAPEGSFLNPRPPAGGGPRAIICYRTFESVLGALAPALPDRVAAAASHMANPTFGGWDRARRRRFVAYELVLSGTGARAAKDGCEAMSWAFNAANIPVEAQEANQPIVVERFELIGDSGGRRQIPRRLRRPARPAAARRRGQADESVRAPELRAVRSGRRPARTPGPHRHQPRTRRADRPRQAVARVRVRRRRLVPAVGRRRLRRSVRARPAARAGRRPRRLRVDRRGAPRIRRRDHRDRRRSFGRRRRDPTPARRGTEPARSSLRPPSV